MKKIILCGLLLISLIGCGSIGNTSAPTQNLNYIQGNIKYTPNINKCSEVVIKKYVDGLGDVKLSYITKARDEKPFLSPKDLEKRIGKDLSDNMIIQIEENFTF